MNTNFAKTETEDDYLTDNFENPEKRTNVTWFYPKVCNFQDKFNTFDDRNRYFDFLKNDPPSADTDILVYLHIPFCEAFCNFCACFKESSAKYQGEEQQRFVRAMVAEIERYARSPYFSGRKVSYVQFGGGTPSALERRSMETIIKALHKNFDLSEVKGISFEGSPLGLSDYGYIEMLKDQGITRMSFGVQTLRPEIRRALTIKATVEQVYATAANIHRAGIRTFALDLMYNLPQQTFEILEADIRGICHDLRPTFVQTYRFNQWEGTRLDQTIRSGKLGDDRPSGLNEWEQYKLITDRLAAYGYDNQLLLNFYTNLKDPGPIGLDHACGGNGYRKSYTLGIGPAAESYMGEYNFRNHTNVQAWIADVEARQIPVPQGRVAAEGEVQDRALVFFPVFGFIKKQNIRDLTRYARKLRFLRDGGYILETEDEIRLTERGKEMAGNIAFLFYSTEEKARARRTMYLSVKNNKNPFHQDDMSMPRESAYKKVQVEATP